MNKLVKKTTMLGTALLLSASLCTPVLASTETITPYKLYTSAEQTGKQKVTNTAVTGKDFNGTFYADRYKAIREKSGTDQKYTVLVYMCGTDLEDDGAGNATKDIMHMLKSNYDLASTNVLILAGGTRDWNSKTMKDASNDDINCCLYYLDPTAFTKNAKNLLVGEPDSKDTDQVITKDSLKLLANFNNVSMGDSQLLLGFMDTAYDLFPAENYWLSMWNHGGGAARGICFGDKDEEEPVHPLTLDRIEEALSNSKICKEQNGFSIISADACLMGGIEVATKLSPYAKYFIGSEDTTYNAVPYEEYFRYFKRGAKLPAASEIAVNASKAYMDTHTINTLNTTTNTVFDLEKLDHCVSDMNAFGEAMNALLSNAKTRQAAYKACQDASIKSWYFGGYAGRASDDYADMMHFLNNLSDELQNNKAALSGKTGTESSLYTAAIQSIEHVKKTAFAAYTDFTSFDDRVTDLCGATLFVPFRSIGYLNFDFNAARMEQDVETGEEAYAEKYTANPDMDQYLSEAIFPGYCNFLKAYAKIANSEKEFNRMQELNKKLQESGYADVISDMQISTCSYEAPASGDSDTLTNYTDYVITLDIRKNAEGLEDSPLQSFMETASGVAVRVMRSDSMRTVDEETGELKEESEKVDIVISTSDYMTPGIFLSENAEIGDDPSASDKLVIDTNLINILACYVTGTSVDSDTQTFDWGTVKKMDEYVYGQLNENYSSKNTVIVEGIVNWTDENQEQHREFQDLIFANNAETGECFYTGYMAYDEETDSYREVSRTENSSIELVHYRLTEENIVERMEDHGEYLECAPTFDCNETIGLSLMPIASAEEEGEPTCIPYNRYGVSIQSADGSVTEYVPEEASSCPDPEAYRNNEEVGTESSEGDELSEDVKSDENCELSGENEEAESVTDVAIAE